jgi:hypothetical protein
VTLYADKAAGYKVQLASSTWMRKSGLAPLVPNSPQVTPGEDAAWGILRGTPNHTPALPVSWAPDHLLLCKPCPHADEQANRSPAAMSRRPIQLGNRPALTIRSLVHSMQGVDSCVRRSSSLP